MPEADGGARSPVVRRIIGTLGVARFLWDLLGVTLILLITVLGLGLGARAAWRSLRSRPAVASPTDGTSWGPAFEAEFEQSLRMQWRPYVYWRRYPITGEFVNVDSAGLRRTIVPWPPAPVRRRVFFMGGSTMWGTGQRDRYTIPSVVAQALGEAGWTGVEIKNFGESGYVFTQEVIQLMLTLRDGARPDLVVFYDGINDIAAGVMEGRGGLPQNETRRALEFSIGRLLSRPGLPELREVMAKASVRAQGFGRFDPRPLLTNDSATAALARSVVEAYVRSAEVVEALAQQYGFRVVYFWQPSPGTTTKPLTDFERGLGADSAGGSLAQYLPRVARAAREIVDSIMTRRFPGRFASLVTVFNRDTTTVWLDDIGHVTEAANERIARMMFPTILGMLGDRP